MVYRLESNSMFSTIIRNNNFALRGRRGHLYISWTCRPGQPVGKLCRCGEACRCANKMITESPKPVPSVQEKTRAVPAEGKEGPGPISLQNRMSRKERSSPFTSPHLAGGPVEEGGARAQPLPGGSVLSPREGPKGGAGRLAWGGGAAHQSRRRAFSVLPFFLLLSRLPSLYQPLFLLLPGGGFLRRRPAFLGAEAVGTAGWRPPVSLATWPPPSARRSWGHASAGVGAGRGRGPEVPSRGRRRPSGCRGNQWDAVARARR